MSRTILGSPQTLHVCMFVYIYTYIYIYIIYNSCASKQMYKDFILVKRSLQGGRKRILSYPKNSFLPEEFFPTPPVCLSSRVPFLGCCRTPPLSRVHVPHPHIPYALFFTSLTISLFLITTRNVVDQVQGGVCKNPFPTTLLRFFTKIKSFIFFLRN